MSQNLTQAEQTEIVQRMIDADESDEDIGAVIQHMGDPVEEMVSEQPGAITGGVGLAAAAAGGAAVKPTLRGVGAVIQKAAVVPKLAMGSLGAGIGAGASTAVGAGPFLGAHAGGMTGAVIGRKLAKPMRAAGKYLAELGAKNPSIPSAAQRALRFAGHSVVRGISKAIPVVGAALTAKDVIDDLGAMKERGETLRPIGMDEYAGITPKPTPEAAPPAPTRPGIVAPKPDNSTKAIDTVMKNELGHTDDDGGSGAPALHGINAKWHPEAYAEAKKRHDADPAAGQAFVRNFYKKEYWDKNNIGSLDPAVQTIVFDAAVNHRSDFSQQLIAAAKAGATPSDLIELRRNEYTRLTRTNPKKHGPSYAGWMNRLKSLETN